MSGSLQLHDARRLLRLKSFYFASQPGTKRHSCMERESKALSTGLSHSIQSKAHKVNSDQPALTDCDWFCFNEPVHDCSPYVLVRGLLLGLRSYFVESILGISPTKGGIA